MLFPPCYSFPISFQVTLDFLSKNFSYSIPFSIILFQHHSLLNSQIALAISCLVYDMSSINNFYPIYSTHCFQTNFPKIWFCHVTPLLSLLWIVNSKNNSLNLPVWKSFISPKFIPHKFLLLSQTPQDIMSYLYQR